MGKIIHGLYGITHHDALSQQQLADDVEAAFKGGMQVLQYRDKTSNANDKKQRADLLLEICKHFQKPLIVNDDPLLCKKVGAHGVHLGQSDSAIKEARSLLGETCLIGVTCHNLPLLAQQAQTQGASYIGLGRFFPSQTKSEAPLASIDCIAEVKKVCSLPLVAIGGITLDNACSLIDAQVDALAVINGLFSAENIESRAQQFSNLFN